MLPNIGYSLVLHLFSFFIYTLFNNIVLLLVGWFWGLHFDFRWIGSACDLYSTHSVNDISFQVPLYALYAIIRVSIYVACWFFVFKFSKNKYSPVFYCFAGYEVAMPLLFVLDSFLFKLYLSNTPLFLLGLHLGIPVVIVPIVSAVLFGITAFRAFTFAAKALS
jgi:hypothetical protein